MTADLNSELMRRTGTQYTFPQHRHRSPLSRRQPPKLKVLRGGADDAIPAGTKAKMQRDTGGQTRLIDACHFPIGNRLNRGFPEIERTEGQVHRTAPGADEQRCRGSPRGERFSPLLDDHLQAQRQEEHQADGG